MDPADRQAPRILSFSELKSTREPLEAFIRSARDEIDRLHNVVRKAGYTVLLCDADGVAIEHRGEDRQADQFRYWGTWLGGVWSEAVEGTNGIGTCIAEERPITVHRAQHFRSRHIDLSCSGAPVFGPDGKLMAVVDVSAIDPTLSEHAHALTGMLTTTSARAIEERFFRECFRRDWIVAIASPDGDASGALLAVDRDQRIVGANRAARTSLSLDDQKLRDGISLWSAFKRNADLFRRREKGDFLARLVIVGSNEPRSALITSPDNSGGGTIPATVVLHARPRLDLVEAIKDLDPVSPASGGLSPRALRRVREYIDEHLGARIHLVELAAVAGLSVYHFAREFKQSTSMTPHAYITQQRVEKAKEMLARTELTLSEIALAAGFFDQSHLTRHFREFAGTTPAEFRWSQS